jgi:hypothetical protein
MAFKPEPVSVDLNRLKSTLLKSGLQQDNNPLYEVIRQLIDAVRQNQKITTDSITVITGALPNEDYLTHSDESAALPNSRELLAGTGVTFDDGTANERTIAVGTGVSGVGYWSPLVLDGSSNGDSELVLTDDNEPIMVWVPTS